jgi:peroxin-5
LYCFIVKNALKKDNKNPDTFLALGVSCTNILDEVKAMNFLKHWYMISELQKQMPISPQLVPEDKEYSEYSLEEIKAINRNMLEAFS